MFFSINLSPAYNSVGELNGVLLLAHDNTEMHMANVRAETATQAKTNFSSNMSHEIRTPLNAVIGMTSIAKSANNIERKDYCLLKIDDASHHLLDVINDILDMSKIEASKFDLSKIDFNFEKMLQRVVNVINFRVEEKKQKFNVHICTDIPNYLYGDDLRLAQIITNLLGNATKFTPERGTVSLNAKLISEANDICTILFEITDTGIGISPEQHSGLFSSFQQAGESTSRKYGGTGLGLSISRNIIEMMGGKFIKRLSNEALELIE